MFLGCDKFKKGKERTDRFTNVRLICLWLSFICKLCLCNVTVSLQLATLKNNLFYDIKRSKITDFDQLELFICIP